MDEPPASEGRRTPGLRDLYRLLSGRRRRQLAGLAILMLAGAVAELLAIGAVLPLLRLVVAPDAVLAAPRLAGLRAAFGWTSADDLLVPAAALLIGAAVVATAIRLLLAWASQRFVYRLGFDLDAALFRRAVRQPYAAHVERHGSEVLGGFEKINGLVINTLLPLMLGATAAVIALCILSLLFWIHPAAAAIVAAVFGGLYLLIGLRSRAAVSRLSQRRSRLVTARTRAVQEMLGGLRDIILDRSQPVHEAQFAQLDTEFRDVQARGALIAATPRYVVEGTALALIGLLAIWFAGRPGGLLAAVPVLGALALGGQRLLPLLQSVYGAVTQYLLARHSLADVLRLLTEPMLPPPVAADGPPPFARTLTVTGLGFRYAAGPAALTGIDLVIRRGERVGLTGPSGSGKSTLVDLLMGLLVPDEGRILIDDVPLTPGNAAAWQAQIAHVPQSVFLLDDTIGANIVMGLAVDARRVEEAVDRAQLRGFVDGLPAGLATPVGERGVRLSGGQRQRIGLARALYKGADVLFLDEATSALDDAMEAGVLAALAGLGREVTVVLIAHRRSTLDHCDRVYQLAAGRIVTPLAVAS